MINFGIIATTVSFPRGTDALIMKFIWRYKCKMKPFFWHDTDLQFFFFFEKSMSMSYHAWASFFWYDNDSGH